MKDITIAVAQIGSIRGDIRNNLSRHIDCVTQAFACGSDLIVFPELSLTGYEPDLAAQLAMDGNDTVLEPLKSMARDTSMTIAVGAPIKNPSGKPNIGTLILTPSATVVYRKIFLHPGEEQYFASGADEPCVIDISGSTVGFAICADIDHEEHVQAVVQRNADIYAAGVLMVGGYDTAANLMRSYARQYSMVTLMANYRRPTGGVTPAGKSAAWDTSGRLLAAAGINTEELIIVKGEDDRWTGECIPCPRSEC